MWRRSFRFVSTAFRRFLRTSAPLQFSARAPAGHVLLRAFAGGALQPEIFLLDESEMVAKIEADLRELLGIIAKPLFTRLWGSDLPMRRHAEASRLSRRGRSMSPIKLNSTDNLSRLKEPPAQDGCVLAYPPPNCGSAGALS